jgi:hypothetical protein
MANTEDLKNRIQEEIKKNFEEDNYPKIDLSEQEKNNLKELVLCNIEPDFCFLIKDTLYIGEITVSGFLHRKSHLGLNKKVTEAFSKFSLIQRRFKDYQNYFSFSSLRCLFITPKIEEKNASDYLGWRKDLFKMSVMAHYQVDINNKLKDEIEAILEKSKDEQKNESNL